MVFDTLGEATVGFILTYWIDPARVDFGVAQDQGLKAVKEAFQREQIEVPITIRSVIMHGPAQ